MREEIGQLLGVEPFLEAFGHEGAPGVFDLLEAIAREGDFGATRLTEDDAGGVIAQEDAGEVFVLDGDDVPGGVGRGDFAIGVEDGDQKFFGTGGSNGGEVGAEVVAGALPDVADGAAFAEDDSATVGIAGEGEGGEVTVDDGFAVGSGLSEPAFEVGSQLRIIGTAEGGEGVGVELGDLEALVFERLQDGGAAF